MQVTITTAPCCWGVDDVSNPDLPPWKRVLDETAAAGYGGLELGPYGYMPLDLGTVSQALTSRGLHIVVGTIFDDLVDPSNRDSLVRQTEEICALVSRLPQPAPVAGQRYPTPYLTVMDWGHDARDYAAGHPDRASRLSDADWADMVVSIHAIATEAAEYNVRPVIHPHAGGYIEFADELERIVADVPADVAGLCLDTGHCYYSGMDPAETLEAYADRLDYVHFKDIDRAVYDRVMGERIRFFEACAQGVMCPIGRGVIDYPAIRATLERIGYGGFITVEQERDPRSAGGSLATSRQAATTSRALGSRMGGET